MVRHDFHTMVCVENAGDKEVSPRAIKCEGAFQSAENRTLWLFMVGAFAVRFAYARWGLWVAGDSAAYLTIAKNIALHHSFSSTVGVPTAWRPPLYPVLIAALWWTDNAPIAAIILVQIICGSATVVLTYLIAKDRFTRHVALAAALAATFAPMTGHYTAVILTEPVFTFLLILGVFFWGRNRAVAAGLAFGLATLTRTIVIPFLVCLPFLALLSAWRKDLHRYLVIVVCAMAVTSIWIARNAIVFRKFILVQSGGYGVNLFAGTIESEIYGDDVWTKVLKDLERNEGDTQDEAEKDRRYMRQAVDRIRSDSSHYLRARVKQYPRLFLDSGDYLLGSRNTTFTAALHEHRASVVLLKVGFVLGNITIFLLGGYGIVVERRRFVSLSHITLFPIFLVLIHLPMWIESRYSLPIMPLMLIFAARGIESLVLSRMNNTSKVLRDISLKLRSLSFWRRPADKSLGVMNPRNRSIGT
ncbi:MAG: glycosyl transferase family 39 [Acidobacteria bacterium]|nr:glycosyl transferase family 39 [Acidobacteriota bacterium]